jgi:Mg2+/citrate symporter
VNKHIKENLAVVGVVLAAGVLFGLLSDLLFSSIFAF